MKKFCFLFLTVLWACTKIDQSPGKSLSQSPELSASKIVHKKIYLKQGSDSGLYINGTRFKYNAGDTLVMQGDWTYCSFEDFYGTQKDPLIIINEDSQQVHLTNGIGFTNCRHIKLTGSGSNHKYGFYISATNGSGVGVNITGRSSYIEVERVDIYNKTYGYWVKEEADCADSLQFPNWVIHQIDIHDGRIRNTGQEGMYLGSTDPNGVRAISCDSVIINPRPLRLGNIKVHNMIINHTTRSGIQLSGATHGDNEIYNNTISNCGFEFLTNQGNGISLGGYTHASVHDNIIKNTYAMGILALGAGLEEIKNNTISNSGSLSGKSVKGMASIMIDTRLTDPVDSTIVHIKNNKLGANTDYSIRVYNTYHTYSAENIICGNSGTLWVDKGIKWGKCPN